MKYTGITQQVFECVKTTSNRDHGTVYAPAGANSGTATTDGWWGTVVLSFAFDPAAQTLDYAILKETGLANDSRIWGGIQETITACQRG